MDLIPGSYEAILTRRLQEALQGLDGSWSHQLAKLESAEAADRLALHLSRVIEKVLAAMPSEDRVSAGTQLISELIAQALRGRLPILEGEIPAQAGALLAQVAKRLPDGAAPKSQSPVVPLLDTALMTNAPGEPRLGSQLVSEIPSADGIDLIMAFIRRSGIAPMREALAGHLRSGKTMRILTTTYTGSTEPAALEDLQAMGARIRVSYDTSVTRLHAKAWVFHRFNGFSTGYIGSSNLTHSAQVHGLEWNLRVSAARNSNVLERMAALFESCWNSEEFIDFEPAVFRAELARQSSKPGQLQIGVLPAIELRLEPFQEQLLECIALERARGHHRNLLVSATGTGKTVMAAVDYARLRNTLPRSRLLFIAHRKEILDQSRATFQYALRDASFGELWVDGERPEHYEHVFASVQSLSRIDLAQLSAKHFDVVIVDEFHHAAAPTYGALLAHLQPQELLGLTATPERSDGQSVTQWFDGRLAAELRLWDAIDKQRLVPFAYYGIGDNTDLRQIPWRRGRGYDTNALSQLLTADDAWARMVIDQLRRKVDRLAEIRALGFCVSVSHAHFMARVFNAYGVASVAVSGDSTTDEREQALRRLAARELQVVFSVDLFNEGVDVPAVDTLLMLRPTDSPTLFLQQLGRGLRRHDGKAMCTVLDFVGQHRREFSFDRRLRSILGGTRQQLIEQVEQGFPLLPSGCHMALEGVARDRVLQSLKDAVPRGLIGMANELRSMHQAGASISLVHFLAHSGLDLEDIYAHGRSWSDLLASAGEDLAPSGPYETAFRKACARLLHLDDPGRLNAYMKWLSQPVPPDARKLSKAQGRWLRMLLSALTSSVDAVSELVTAECAQVIWAHPQVRAELLELFGLLEQRIHHLGHALTEKIDVPLRVHSRYSRTEIQAAFGDVPEGLSEHDRIQVPPWREGVRFMRQERCDVFLITLTKTEKRFSPSTRYRDYAISRSLFHWESQSRTTADSPTGRRYQEHRSQGTGIMLFVRLNADDRAFYFLGPASYLSHQAEMPMQITWRLTYPLPADLFMAYRAAAA
jgi:superfamily II DNA or RNA helicase/HKD family nuclease